MLAHKQFYSHAARVLSAEDSQVGREADLFSISTAISDRDYCKAAKWYQSNIRQGYLQACPPGTDGNDR